MEFLYLGGISLTIALFVWLCTLRGDQTYREEKHVEPTTPGWARLLFILFVGGLLAICLVPGIMLGLNDAGVVSGDGVAIQFFDSLVSRPPDNWTVK